MTLAADDKKWIIQAMQVINQDIITQVGDAFKHMSRRFDDIEKRLEGIEGRLNMMNKETKMIPDILGILNQDGIDIAQLEIRIDKLGV